MQHVEEVLAASLLAIVVVAPPLYLLEVSARGRFRLISAATAAVFPGCIVWRACSGLDPIEPWQSILWDGVITSALAWSLFVWPVALGLALACGGPRQINAVSAGDEKNGGQNG